MNGTSREPLSSECIRKCIVDAYAYEGDALVVQMVLRGRPKPGLKVNMPTSDPKEGYEFVVIDIWKYEFLLNDDVVESPRSGGSSHDKCALDAFSELQTAGYEVLAWRPYCKEAIPYMDRDGNTLPIDERPPLKTLEELEDTVEDSTVYELRKQILQLKEKLRSKAIGETRLQMLRLEDVRSSSNTEDQHLAKLLEGLLDKMALSAERRRFKHLELKAAMLQKELDLSSAFTEFHLVLDDYNGEKAKNPQSQSLQLVKFGSDLKGARDRISEASMAIGRAKKEMEAAEQNLLEEYGIADRT
ncbi:hypothetical protein FANTH_3825 [Fusarium anthophilum]|uniref:Uncharacterized protein n=1 Tax=Fusarium anthophilum TaxID=48485 RepID=A0A8H4ZQZ0_9HYPO|nr:hypothetical protein FANTH_3825 [Fusarium anthophilum]